MTTPAITRRAALVAAFASTAAVAVAATQAHRVEATPRPIDLHRWLDAAEPQEAIDIAMQLLGRALCRRDPGLWCGMHDAQTAVVAFHRRECAPGQEGLFIGRAAPGVLVAT